MSSKERNHQLEKRTEKFALQVVRICSPLPFNSVNKVLVDQVVRSSASVGANYIEANESLSKSDFIYRIKLCRKEARETGYWLKLLSNANNNAKNEISGLRQESRELFLIFCGILKNVEGS